MPRPVPFGSGSSARRVLGFGRVKIDSVGTGGNSTLVWVDGYRDIHGFALQYKRFEWRCPVVLHLWS